MALVIKNNLGGNEMLFFDSTIVYLIPAMLLTLYAQSKVKSTFNRYVGVATTRGYTGAQVAESLLRQKGLYDVSVQMTSGHLSDHYDPRKKAVRLSQDVYNGTSIASVSVAAHEVGHAIQHAEGYFQLKLRNAILPLANLGSKFAWFFIFAGLLFYAETGYTMMNIGIAMFSMAVLFQVFTLPVEFNASSRAVNLLATNGFIVDDERSGAKKVLNAAALTYVAAMAAAIAQLVRLIAIRNRKHRR